MNRSVLGTLLTAATIGSLLVACQLAGLPLRTQADEPVSEAEVLKAGENSPTTAAEARGRARLLHETIHGALQVMHRDFFREDAGQTIPSRSLDDVFLELARSQHVKVRWLAVNTNAMSIEHHPRTDFEQQAVKALSSGKQEYEQSTDGLYQHVGVIRLSAHCLKCHLPSRTSTKDRAAGLVITMPLNSR